MRPRILILIAILGLATALRLYHLDYRALWWDEGLSLLFARLDYLQNAQMAEILADTNPPLYRLLLGVWINLVGSSAFATRLFSVLPGVLTVALTYRLGRVFRFSVVTSVIATALCAVSPILIFYAQEAKGYSLATMAVIASLVLWKQLTPPRSVDPEWKTLQGIPSLWLVWGVMVALAFGSHYIAAFFIVVEYIWTLVLAVGHWRGNERSWLAYGGWMLGAQSLTVVFVLPYALLTMAGTSAVIRGDTGEFVNLNATEFWTRHLLELTQGPNVNGVSAWAVAVVVVGLLVIGYWTARLDFEAKLQLWSWVVIPIALGFALNTYHEFFFPRFVLGTVPVILLLVSEGLVQLSFWVSGFKLKVARLTSSLSLFTVSPAPLRVGAVLFIVSLWTPTLIADYNAPTAEGEDWRPIAETLRPLMREGDAAIYTWGWIPGYLYAYLPPAPLPDFTLGFFKHELVDSQMRAITAGRERIWLLDYGIDHFDGRNLAGQWLRKKSALVHDSWPGDGKGHVALFVLQPTHFESEALVTAEFTNGLTLETQQMVATLAPGDALVMRLRWSPTRRLSERYTIYLHGIAEDGTLAFGRDAEPYNNGAFVTEWLVGKTYEELRGVLIPSDVAPGNYVLSIGLYKTLTGEGDERGAVVVGEIVIK